MKQLKSSYEDLREFTLNRITAQHVAESLTSFDTSANAQAVRQVLDECSFDVAGARESGQVVGYINRVDLSEGLVGQFRREFEDEDIIPATKPLKEVFDKLQSPDRLFVEVLGQVGGIITRGDSQKMPVRLWLFGLISLLEMQMLRLVRQFFPDESWKKLLKQDRIQQASKTFELRKGHNQEIDLVDCLQLCDKREIFRQSELLDHTRIDSKKEFDRVLKRIEELRNNLAHSQDIVSERWPELLELAGKLEGLLANLEAVPSSLESIPLDETGR